MKKALQGILIVIFLAAAAVVLWKWTSTSTPAPDAASPMNSSHPQQQTLPPITTKTPPSAQKAKPALVNFVATEARSLDSPNVDAAAAERRMAEWAASMTDEDITYALDVVLSEDAPANQQIIATDLIGRSNAPSATRARKEIALRESPYSRPQHSTVEEQKNARIKAESLMAIDGQAAKAATDPEAREELKRWAAEAKDPFIKKYIEKAIQKLPRI